MTEAKIVLYDADGTKVGETFTRRARQLVKQQRAQWTDEEHTAIQFAPDEREAWEAAPEYEPEPAAAGLIALAEQRLRSRARFYLYTLGLLPGLGIILIIGETFLRRPGINQWELGFFIGVACTLWTLGYVRTVLRFIQLNNGFFPFAGSKNRRAKRLAKEVARMKAL